jgi:hypothetical protein
MFDVRYLYLFLDAYLIYIKEIIAYTRKKKSLSKKPIKIFFVFIYLFKKISSKKKTQISNSYYKLIWLSSYEKKTYLKLLKLKKKINRFYL